MAEGNPVREAIAKVVSRVKPTAMFLSVLIAGVLAFALFTDNNDVAQAGMIVLAGALKELVAD